MKKFNLQLFAEAVQGKSIVYLFRILGENTAAAAMAFTTENERSKSKDADVTATKDGSIRTPGAAEIEISATAILVKGDTLTEKLEAAMDEDKLIEIWEVNLDAPGTGEGKFKGTYYQGYLTEFNLTSSAEQQEVATYVFKDTTEA